MELPDLQARIKDISKRHGLSHIGSCLSVLPILSEIYMNKKKGEKVVLDNAHAHVAHLVVREAYDGLKDIEFLLDKSGIHCDREAGCDASGGSLGHGLGIAIGLVLGGAPKVYAIVSDGSMMEGSNWEALRIIHDLELEQINIYCNFNGFTAVSQYDSHFIERRMKAVLNGVKPWYTKNTGGFEGVQGHYRVL